MNPVPHWILIFILLTVVCCHSPKADETILADPGKTRSTSIVDSFEILRPSLWVGPGLSEPKDRQRQIVDEWYHFRYVLGGTCTDAQLATKDQHNKKTESIMTVRMGKDWYKKFERSVDSLFTIDSLAIEIAKADQRVKKFGKATEKHNDKYNFYPNLRYYSNATPDDDIKVVTVEGYGIVYNKVGDLNYLRATIDLKKKKVISIDWTSYSIW